jgi:hypothetical protein
MQAGPSTPAAPAPGSQAETTQKLDEAERKDSGRGFELFYLDGSVGASYINMAQFASTSLDVGNASSAGPAVSLGAGLRLFILTLGARARYNALSAFSMWQLNGELGFKVPVKSIDVLLGLHGGYSFVGSLANAGDAGNSSTPTSSDAVSIRGFNGGLDLAVDYYVTPLFSIGLGLLGDVLFLKRPPLEKPAAFSMLPAEQQAAINNSPLYQATGNSAGVQLAGGLRLGLHLGL